MAKEKPAVKKEKNVWEIQIIYKGQKSRKGTYFPYNISKDNKYGAVGQIYFPINKDIPDEVILRPPAGKQTVE